MGFLGKYHFLKTLRTAFLTPSLAGTFDFMVFVTTNFSFFMYFIY